MPAKTSDLLEYAQHIFPEPLVSLEELKDEAMRIDLAYAMGERNAVLRLAALWHAQQEQIDESRRT